MGGSESKGREENGETKESSDTALAKVSSDTALAKESIAATLAKGAIILVAIGVAILALGVAVGVASLMADSSESSEEKTMKAPGRNGRIARDDFERDPAAYFGSLWRAKREEK